MSKVTEGSRIGWNWMQGRIEEFKFAGVAWFVCMRACFDFYPCGGLKHKSKRVHQFSEQRLFKLEMEHV